MKTKYVIFAKANNNVSILISKYFKQAGYDTKEEAIKEVYKHGGLNDYFIVERIVK
jgi:hypothetical protein